MEDKAAKQRQSTLNGKTQLQANLPEAKGDARDKAAKQRQVRKPLNSVVANLPQQTGKARDKAAVAGSCTDVCTTFSGNRFSISAALVSKGAGQT